MQCRRCRELVVNGDDICPKCRKELGLPEPEAQGPPPPPESFELEKTPAEPEFDDRSGSEDDAQEFGIVHGAVDEDAALAEVDDGTELAEPLVATSVAGEMGADSEESDSVNGNDLIPESPFVSSLAEGLGGTAAKSEPEAAETPDATPSLITSLEDQLGRAEPAPSEPPPTLDIQDLQPVTPAPSTAPQVPDSADLPPVAQPPMQIDSVPTPSVAAPEPPRPPAKRPRQPESAASSQTPPEKKRPKRPPPRPSRKKRGSKVVKALFLIVVLTAVGIGGYYAGTGELPPQLASIPALNRWLGGTQPEAIGDSVPGVLVVQIDASDATLWINDEFVNRRRHELLRGEYQLRVVAPGFAHYTATVSLSPGDTVVHAVVMQAAAQCESPDDPGYNPNNTCFDVAPRLVGSARFAVPITTALPSRPENPAVLSIEVLADGTAGTIVVKHPSDVPQFAIQAVAFAKGLSYEVATKNGLAVVGWVELEFYAGNQPS